MSKLVSLSELSQILGKSQHSLRYHLKMGRIKPAYRLGRAMTFDVDQVLQQLRRDIKRAT